MTQGSGEGDVTLAPDDAFAVLGNETRIQILHTLGEADEPLSFTEVRERVGIRQGAQFNYHLDKLVGHFVRKTDEGYALRRPGQRVVMAVLAGAVTDDPVIEPTETDLSCWYCGAPVEISFRHERATAYCTECSGTYGPSVPPGDRARLGYMYLPSAGIKGRTPAEVYEAGVVWGNFELLARATEICPHCSAPLEVGVSVCEDHDAAEGLCDACDRRYAVMYETDCTNCVFDEEAIFFVRLLASTDLRAFLLEHGINPIAPSPTPFFEVTSVYEEEVRSTDPFEARFTFTIDGDHLVVTVDDDLNLVDAAH